MQSIDKKNKNKNFVQQIEWGRKEPTFHFAVLIQFKVKGYLTLTMTIKKKKKNTSFQYMSVRVYVCVCLAWDQSFDTHQLINIHKQVKKAY